MRVLLLLAALAGPSCQTQQVPIAAGPQAPSSQDPTPCAASCAKAQTACASLKSVDYCTGKCEASARAEVSPGTDCLAVMFTCNKECTQ